MDKDKIHKQDKVSEDQNEAISEESAENPDIEDADIKDDQKSSEEDAQPISVEEKYQELEDRFYAWPRSMIIIADEHVRKKRRCTPIQLQM